MINPKMDSDPFQDECFVKLTDCVEKSRKYYDEFISKKGSIDDIARNHRFCKYYSTKSMMMCNDVLRMLHGTDESEIKKLRIASIELIYFAMASQMKYL